MIEPTLDQLMERLDRLERWNRRLGAMLVAALLGTVATLLMGQAPPHRSPRTLEAEEFVLRDSRGQIRAMLGASQKPSGTGLQIYSEDGKPRTRLILSSDGTASLEFLDTSERVRVLLGVRENGAPRLWLGNEAGKIVWRAP
ncbi:MAG TPA: hypothetical protein VFO18_10850 [Methylomirabilota bacterium]|nr:hypothetical protein [Methylomirabilota bacterium]